MQLAMHMVTIEDLMPQGHFLRKLEAALDLSFVYEETARLYNRKLGRPPIDPVVIVKYLLVGFLYGIPSERQIEQRIQTDIALRWYLGLDLFDGLGQIARFIFGRGQHVEGDTLRALRPDAGQPPESVDQSLYCAVISKCHGYSSLFVLIIHPSASWQAGCSWGSSDHLPRIARLF